MTEKKPGCGKLILETERLLLREMTQADLDALCKILCDEDVMRAAYESVFTREEAQGWLNRHLKRYREYGFGLWAVVLKETGKMIGQCGLTLQNWKEKEILEITGSGDRLQRIRFFRASRGLRVLHHQRYPYRLTKGSRAKRNEGGGRSCEKFQRRRYEFLSLCCEERERLN